MKCFQVLDLFFALQTIASRLDSGIAAHRQFLIHKADQVVVIIVTEIIMIETITAEDKLMEKKKGFQI
jgi:hypothetical protein